jgi:superfamily I DNA/RNA helicase
MIDHPHIHLVLGGPGSGKTHRLLNIMDLELAKDTPPNQIAFVSFTRKAVNEARDRARKKFGFKKKDFLYFRTIHSLAFMQLGLTRSDVFGISHLKKVSQMTNMDVGNRLTINSPFQISDGDKSLFIENYARLTKQRVEQIWSMLGEYISWYKLLLFLNTMNTYKETYGLYDFTDMLTEYSQIAEPLEVDVAIVDEAQDLNAVQWDIIGKAFKNVRKLYIAGDDDQAIYKWSGADLHTFLNLPAELVETLPKSWRLGPEIFYRASNVIKKVKTRYKKEWEPNDHKCHMRMTRSLDRIDLSEGSWYLLARNKHLLTKYVDMCRRQGVLYSFIGESPVDKSEYNAIRDYERLKQGVDIDAEAFINVLNKLGHTLEFDINPEDTYDKDFLPMDELPIWHDTFPGISMDNKMYYLNARRNGQQLLEEPRITIDTIHAVKGGEADNVILMMDVSKRTYENYRHDADDEFRVFYVGMTRARYNLWLLLPQTIRSIPII